jgi:hypothetical protein
MVYPPGDLPLAEQPLELLEVLEFSQEFSPEDAANMTSALESQFGNLPYVLVSGRVYSSAYYPESSEGDTEFLVNTINNTTIQTGESVWLIVFLDLPVEPQPSALPFFQLEWFVVNIVFSK